MSRRGAALLFVCFAWPSLATAQEPRALSAVIAVEAEDECVDAAGLAARIAVLLGPSPLDPALHVVVTSIADGGLAFAVHRGEEEIARRRFSVLPTACDARLAAFGLAVALALDHTLLERLGTDGGEETVADSSSSETSAPETASTATSPPPAPVPPSGSEVRAPLGGGAVLSSEAAAPGDLDGSATPADGWDLGLEFGVASWLSVLFSPAFGGVVAFEASEGIASLRVCAFGAASLSTGLDSGHFDSQLLAGQVAGCAAWRQAPLGLGGCFGAAAGWLGAQGADFPTNFALSSAWVGLTLEAFVALTIAGPVALRLGVEGVLSLLRTSVTVEDPEGEALATSTSPIIGASPSLSVVVWL